MKTSKLPDYFFLFLRIVIGLSFLVSGYGKLLAIEEFELSILETGMFPEAILPFISRLIIGAEFLIGITIITRTYFRISILSCILMLSVFSIYLVYLIYFKPFVKDCGCFGDLIAMKPEVSLIKNIITIVLSYFTLRFYRNQEDLHFFGFGPKKLIINFTILCFALPFIVYPMGSPEVGKITDKDNKMEMPSQTFFVKDKFYEELSLSGQKKVVCFFSLHCKYCKAAARKFTVFHKKNSNFVPYIIFIGKNDDSTKVDLKKFQEETGTENLPYSFMEKKQFFEIGGNRFPAIYFVDDSRVQYKHTFLTINEENLTEFIAPTK